MENNERLVFLTNDDSYAAPGFEVSMRIARRFGRVIAIAPETAQSGMSQAITMNSPLYLRRIKNAPEGVELYALNGTPVDCVKMAFDNMLRDRRVDLVITGINHGSNAAINVLYSGTMGAAIEGSFYGCPSIGLSLCDHSLEADFTGAERYCTEIVRRVVERGVAAPLCLNVNVPAIPADEIRGVRVCRQSRGFWREEFFRRHNPLGREYYWLTGEFKNAEPDSEDTDEWALAHGYVSVVPIQVDMTDYGRLDELKINICQ